MTDTHKPQRDNIRTTIRNKRKALSDVQLQTSANALLTNCKPYLDNSKHVAGYNAMQGEIRLSSVFDYCHAQSITTYLPIMRDQRLLFAPFNASTAFITANFGILEPDVNEDQLITPNKLDLALVPLVAFDATCNRIGMGGGFYDRSFEFRKTEDAPPTLLGVAHALQQVPNVYAQDWDVALDAIATDENVIVTDSY